MAAIDFPDSPAINDTFSAVGKTWRWTGITWDIVATVLDFVQTVTGDGVDNTDPQNPVISYPTLDDLDIDKGNLIAGTGVSFSGGTGVDQILGSNITISINRDVDGGSAASIYLITQSIDGGIA